MAPPSSSPSSPTSYRYIVIGAGCSGSVVAGGLGAGQKGQVLLLEVGPAERDKSTTHASDWARAAFTSTNVRHYSCVPQAHHRGRVFMALAAVGKGGGTLVNATQYSRGYVEDYEHWPRKDWSREDVERCFKAGEDAINLEYDQENPLGRAFGRAAEEIGMTNYTQTQHAGGGVGSHLFIPQEPGYAPMAYMVKGRRRRTVYEAFVEPVLGQGTITVESGAGVTRINIRPEDKVVTGVTYRNKDSQLVTAALEAGGEVVLCAGALESPKLLMLSGIGPPEHLEEMGITPLVPLDAVGENLQDHPLLMLAVMSRQKIDDDSRARNSMHGWVNAINKEPEPQGGQTRVQILCSDSAVAPDLVSEMAIPRYDIWWWSLLRSFLCLVISLFMRIPLIRRQAQQTISLLVCLMNPKSRGRVRLASTDPRDPPAIDPRYLEAAEDRAGMKWGLDLARRLLNTPAMEAYHGAELLPGWLFSGAKTEGDFGRYASLYCGTYFHPVGTCRLGEEEDERAVVGPRLKVRGVQGLRVVDASVIPVTMGAGSVGACLMIAHRAVEMILEDSKARRASSRP